MIQLLIFSYLLTAASSGKILCIFHGISHSHYTLGFRLMEEMANRGHDVTFISPYKEDKPIKNFKSVVLTGFAEEAEEFRKEINVFEMLYMPSIAMIPFLGNFGLTGVDNTLENQAIKNLLERNETYDVIITEHFFSEALLGIAYQLKTPSILFSTIGQSIWTNHMSGTPDTYSYMPHFFLGYTQEMTFWQRLSNVFISSIQKLYDHIYYLPQQNQIVQKHMPGTPHIYDLLRNISLFMFNSDVSYWHTSLLTPNMIEIGGYHVRQPKKLPEDLQKYLDDAKHGVIYFSMGSNLQSKDLPKKSRDAILHVFSKLKQKILWKFEDDLPELPPNVQIRKWFPQGDILAHPNLKLFITHGGLLSTTESVYHGVPLIGIPVYGDQDLNMNTAVDKGYGIAIPYAQFTEEKFAEAIKEMLNNPSYFENAKRRSALLKDKQVTQMDKAVYWIEYVIRHKGASHLRSPAVDLTWYQYYSLDVILFLVLAIVLSFKLFVLVIKKIFRKKNKQKTN